MNWFQHPLRVLIGAAIVGIPLSAKFLRICSSYIVLYFEPFKSESAAHQSRDTLRHHDSQQRQQSSPPHPQPPNILLLFPDQWRYDWDGRPDQNLPLDIPTIRALTKNGTKFMHAYVASPLCAPGRACLASGLEYDMAGVPTNMHNDYDLHIPTFYQILRDKYNYNTYTVGKDDLTKASQLGTKTDKANWTGHYHQNELGFVDGSSRCSGKMDMINPPSKPHERYGHWLQNHTLALKNGTTISGWDGHAACMIQTNHCTPEFYPDQLYEDNYVTDQAISILRQQPNSRKRPWFLQVNFPGPHPPFMVTPAQYRAIMNKTFPPPFDNPHVNISETCTGHKYTKTTSRCNYAAEMENLDSAFGKILGEIHGDLNNTIVCFSSDHGEMLLDHSWNGKTVPWQGSVSVPLICTGPNVRPGAKIERPVSTMDLAATFLDYASSGSSSQPSTANVHVKDDDSANILETASITVPDKERIIGTSKSLRRLLETGQDGQYREYVSSGLQDVPFGHDGKHSTEKQNNWRMVVEAQSGLKLVCCKGYCRATPSTISPKLNEFGYQQILVDTINDPFDTRALNDENPIALKRLKEMLPAWFGCK